MRNHPDFLFFLRRRPEAWACIRGSETAIGGTVGFYGTPWGTLVRAEITGLPNPSSIFGFHIHAGGSCTGNESDPFADAGMHYNPQNRPHPYHAGDLPPLFGANGRAFSVFLTDRFTPEEVIGKTIIIHSHPDDFTTQPSGNAGEKLACGEIEPFFYHSIKSGVCK